MILKRPSVLFLPIALSLLLIAGCGDDPTATDDTGSGDLARVLFDGSYDGEDFVLQRIGGPNAGYSLELVATDIRALSPTASEIEVDVALRNSGRTELFGPIKVFLGRFVPSGVTLLNGDERFVDRLLDDGDPSATWPYRHFFEYTDELGGEGMRLGPGEQSEPRTWHFALANAGGFSFGSEAWVGTEPGRARLGGTVFLDRNRNGLFELGEPVAPFGVTGVMVRFPDGRREAARTDESGRWSVAVRMPGIYEVKWMPPPTLQFAPVCLTTPDPLQVLLVSGADGTAMGFRQADIGIDPEPCGAPPGPLSRVELVDGPADDVSTDHFFLLNAELVRDRDANSTGALFEGLQVEVGFSGCSGGHPFTLFVGKEFMESSPVQTWMRLSHDDRGELCDAYFEETRLFDLGPVRRWHRELYGTEGPIVLHLETPDGQSHRFELP